MVHGPAKAAAVESAAGALFGRGELADLDLHTLTSALAELPVAEVSAGPLPGVVELLIATGLEKSGNSARRTIAEGGAYLNNVKITDEAAAPGPEDLLHGEWLLLRRGKRNLAGVRVRGGARR